MENEEIIATSGGNFVLPPAGNQLAICSGVAMIGTHEEVYEGKPKGKQKKVIIFFELVNTNHVFDEKKGPEPFVMPIELTLSTHKKSSLRKLLESWKGSPFTDAEADKVNLTTMVGFPCFANVIIDKNSKGDDRAKIVALAAVPEGIAVPEQRTPRRVFTFNPPFKTEVFNALPKWIQEKIQKSDEYKALAGTSTTTAPAANPFGQETVTKGNMPF